MKRIALSVALFASVFFSFTASALAENNPVTVSSDQFVSIQLPDSGWSEEATDNHSVLFSDGSNKIQIEVYQKGATLPEFTVANDTYEAVYESCYSNKKYVILTTGFMEHEENYTSIKESIDSIKLDQTLADLHLISIKSEGNDAQSTSTDTSVTQTGNTLMLCNDSGYYFTIYEYSNGSWHDENGMAYYSAMNQDGYYTGEDGSTWRLASDIGQNTPDYIVYGADGMERQLYDNGDGTANDAYGNPYQNAGDAGWIDYYGNHYYEGWYRNDYESNDYTEDETVYDTGVIIEDENTENGFYYGNSEYVTSTDGQTRLIYWQNEFYAIDDNGIEYIFSGEDGSFRSSDGLEF